jgi:predicted nucleic acid-binding protein
MIFDNLQTGDTVFVDANTLIYHFTNHPKFGAPCTRLLERIELNDLRGFTASNCLADVAHRVMTIEAMGRMGWPATSLASRLKKHHKEIPKLVIYQQATAKVGQLGIRILAISEQLVLAATSFSQQFELLTDDALIVAVMHDQGLTKIASEDADFDPVPGLTRYGPA